jgi:EmrB/QacA subfamily drug resistance transporter
MATSPRARTSGAAHAGINPRRWQILAVLVVSLLVVVLDNTILNVALKTIQQDLAADQSELVWAVNGYSLAFASLLFTWGVLGDRYGRKRMLMVGLAMFAASSALSAFATTPAQLIACRVLMGATGACALPISLSVITVVFPPDERGRAIGLWAASVGAAVAIGPITGGLLLEHPWLINWLTGNDWGSVFFVNVPVIAAGLVGIALIVPETRNPRPARLDPHGLLLSIAGLLLLVYGIQEGAWGHWTTYAWIIGGLLLLTGFVLYERHTPHPSIDLSLFRVRSFSVSLAGVSLAFGALQGVILFLAFYYQVVRGWSPLESGLLTLPFAVGQLIAAPRSGGFVARFGARRVIMVGLGLAGTGMLLLALVPQRAPVWYLILLGFIFGFGLGCTMAPATTRMTLATPPARSGSGSAVQNTVRQVGAALGVAIISAVVASVYGRHIAGPLEASPLPDPARQAASDSVGSTYEVGDRLIESGQATPAQVAPLLQAANDAFMPAFHVASLVALGLLLLALGLFAAFLPAEAEEVDWTSYDDATAG